MKYIFILIILFVNVSFAQNKKFRSYKGKITNDGAIVYKDPDFDSQVLGYVKVGGIYEISSKTFGVFYRIQVKPGLIGYIADSDVQPLNKSTSGAAAKQQDEAPKEKRKKQRSFENARYIGPQYSYLNYNENTMGQSLSENLNFFGLKLSGPYLIIDGPINTEMNFLFKLGAPTYYEKYTGNSAAGWIFISDFLLQMVLPQGRNAMFYFGFGPMFRYSKFQVMLANTSYNLEDMALGAAFNLGIGLRMGGVAVRTEVKYNWEKYKYLAANLALQFEF